MEYARATSRKAGSVLIDLQKAYELVRHNLAVGRAAQAGFPLSMARLAVLMYGSPRFISQDGACSRTVRLGTSIVAG